MSESLLEFIQHIKQDLKNLAEDETLPIDVKVHRALWHEIQSIDFYLDNEVKND